MEQLMANAGRHVDFFALMEALEHPGCPACRLADAAERRFIQTLFDEQVTDPQTRARLRLAGGFCSRHTEVVLGLGDALGSSIIYADLLAEAARSFTGGGSERCPACETGREATRCALGALVDHLSEDDVLAAYVNCDGLCLEHLRQATSASPPVAADRLAEIERKRLLGLAAECREFVAKSDYLRIGEAMGRERDAWRRAALKLGGGFSRDGTE